MTSLQMLASPLEAMLPRGAFRNSYSNDPIINSHLFYLLMGANDASGQLSEYCSLNFCFHNPNVVVSR